MVSLDPLCSVECGLNIVMVGYSEKGKYGPEHTVPFRSFQAFRPRSLMVLWARLGRADRAWLFARVSTTTLLSPE